MNTIYLEKRDVGATLTCWVACLMWLDWCAYKQGLVGYYYWPRLLPNRTGNEPSSIVHMQDANMFAQEPNMFDWFFVQPNSDKLNLIPGQLPPKVGEWMWEDPTTMPAGIPGIWPMGQETYAWYSRLKVQPAIVARADAIVKKYGLDLSQTVGVTRRGCEAALDEERDWPSEAIENYFPHLDQLTAAEPDLKIMVTSEELGDAEKVAARYPGKTAILSEFWTVPAGYGANIHNVLHSGWCNPVSGYERGVLTCLIISLMSRCKYYIKNKSNMSSIAGWIKGGKGVIRIGNKAHTEFWG